MLEEPGAAEAARPRPWRRFIARVLDFYSVPMTVGFVLGFFAPDSYLLNDATDISWHLLTLGGLVLYETMAAVVGVRTLGKWLLNTHVRSSTGEMLTGGQAAARTVWVILSGLWLGIPLLSAIAAALQHGKLTRDGATSYDRKGGYRVTHGPMSALRWGGVAVTIAVVVGALFLGAALE